MACPSECICSWNSTNATTDCSSMNLYTINGDNVDNSTTYLDLSNNHLTELPDLDVQYSSLVTIDARRNGDLVHIPTWVSNLANLTSLLVDKGSTCCVLEKEMLAQNGTLGKHWVETVCQPTVPNTECTDHLLDIFTLVLYGLVAAASFIINTWVLVVLYGTKNRRTTPTQLLMGQFPVSNLLMTFYTVVLLERSVSFYNEYHYHQESWIHSQLCTLCGFIFITSNLMSTQLYLLTIIEMYIKIAFPFKDHLHLTGKKLNYAILILWIISLSVATLPLFKSVRIGMYNVTSMCIPVYSGTLFGLETNIWLRIYASILTLCFETIVVLLILLLRSVSHQRHSNTLTQENRRLVYNVIFMIAIHIVLWSVLLICLFMSTFGTGELGYYGRIGFSRLAVLETILNVTVYIIRKRTFQEDTKRFIKLFFEKIRCTSVL
ncbi:unnamed protein product [Owenia fusiformis]|uniref:Uncharacterized protein n=1 Tax=Owenia fusiformis TaxID=6347 RepID=A0A8J1TXB1_OWEFU|nr:unnamed protein product [Owenia fusiformis]